MLDKTKDYGQVFGTPSIAYEQNQPDGSKKYFNQQGLEVEIGKNWHDVKVIEGLADNNVPDEKPKQELKDGESLVTFDDFKPELTIHERIRIKDQENPNFLTEDNIREELIVLNVNFDKRLGRKKLVDTLKKAIGDA